MQGVIAGSRPRASTLREGTFTVSEFSFSCRFGPAVLEYRTAATEDNSGAWTEGEPVGEKEINRAVKMWPRRPEVGRIGVMTCNPNDGLNFFSPDA